MKTNGFLIALPAVLALVIVSACNAKGDVQSGPSTSASSCPTASCRSISEVVVGAGRACTVNGQAGPTTYSAWDAGKPGVPRLSTSDLVLLRNIMKYVHPRSLRFVYLDGEFVVFDSYPGLCNGGAPFYVLSAQQCNQNYAITDVPDATTGGGEMGCVNHPRPWIAHDKGVGNSDAWLHYDNSH